MSVPFCRHREHWNGLGRPFAACWPLYTSCSTSEPRHPSLPCFAQLCSFAHAPLNSCVSSNAIQSLVCEMLCASAPYVMTSILRPASKQTPPTWATLRRCVANHFPGLTWADTARACTVCRGVCNCRGCLRKEAPCVPKVTWGPDTQAACAQYALCRAGPSVALWLACEDEEVHSPSLIVKLLLSFCAACVAVMLVGLFGAVASWPGHVLLAMQGPWPHAHACACPCLDPEQHHA